VAINKKKIKKKERDSSHVGGLTVLESGKLCKEKLTDGHGTGRNR
jgi:hypothetical protein